ncbi:DUF6125 family protein [Chloroflexota bacterium]
MAELNDYSGPFKPDLTFDDFSKEFLLKLMTLWQFAWLHMNTSWFEVVKERFGIDAAIKCNLQAIVEASERVYPRYPKVAGYEPTTVREAMKSLQLGTVNNIGGLFPSEYEFKSDNHLIWTIVQCRGLLAHERRAPEMIYPTCHILEKAILKKQLINPRIKVTPLKLPPRESYDEIACQWELKLEE